MLDFYLWACQLLPEFPLHGFSAAEFAGAIRLSWITYSTTVILMCPLILSVDYMNPGWVSRKYQKLLSKWKLFTFSEPALFLQNSIRIDSGAVNRCEAIEWNRTVSTFPEFIMQSLIHSLSCCFAFWPPLQTPMFELSNAIHDHVFRWNDEILQRKNPVWMLGLFW